MNEIFVTLKHPIKVDGVVLDRLTIRRPKLRDMLLVEKKNGSDGEKTVALIANLADLAPKDLEELDMEDYTAAQATVNGFTPTGGTN